MNATPSLVAQDRALAAQRLREQRPRHRRVVQRGRVELHELEVGARDAGPQRHRDAVAGRQRGVRGDREALAGAAGREHDVGGAHDSTGRRRGEREHARAAAVARRSSSIANQPSRTSTPDALHRGDERPLDLGAGGVAARVHDPGEEWPPSRASASSAVAVGLVEVRAERDELAHPVGALGHEHPHRVDVAEPRARGQRVGEVQLGRVGPRSSAAATPPCAYAVADCESSPLVSTSTDRPSPRGVERGREPGDAAPEHEDVDHGSA